MTIDEFELSMVRAILLSIVLLSCLWAQHRGNKCSDIGTNVLFIRYSVQAFFVFCF